MTSCIRPGCAGRIMATGYCDTCGHRHHEPRTEPPPPPPDPATEEPPGPGPPHAVAGVGELDQHGLVRLPDVPAPESGLVEDIRPPTGGRRCGANGCTMTIGIGYGGPPPRPTRRCPPRGTPHSFLPPLPQGDLGDGHHRVLGRLPPRRPGRGYPPGGP